MSRASTGIHQQFAAPPNRLTDVWSSSEFSAFPTLPVSGLQKLAVEAGEAEGRARMVQLLAQDAMRRNGAVGEGDWPEAAEHAAQSPEDAGLALELVRLRGRAAVLRSMLDGVVYPAPEGTEERLAEVETQIAEASTAAARPPSEAAGAGTHGVGAGEPAADGEAAAEGAEHAKIVAASLASGPWEIPQGTGMDLGAALSALRREVDRVQSGLSKGLEGVRE